MQHDYSDGRKAAAKLDKALSPDSIPMFGGRPLRSTRIGKDDILDLKILLNTTLDVDQVIPMA